jgi:8-oxo-dGTP pyrophosphatase MutT (NUDIX family)
MEPDNVSRGGAYALFIRMGMYAVRHALIAGWFVLRPRTFGVRVIPVTRDGRIVLIRHSYAPGWYFPGGGQRRDEDPAEAMLRELREEIGMTAHGEVTRLAEYRHDPDFKRDTMTFFLVRDVEYVPRLSLEIEAIAAFPLDTLPPDISPATARRIAEWQGRAPVSERW